MQGYYYLQAKGRYGGRQVVKVNQTVILMGPLRTITNMLTKAVTLINVIAWCGMDLTNTM